MGRSRRGVPPTFLRLCPGPAPAHLPVPRAASRAALPSASPPTPHGGGVYFAANIEADSGWARKPKPRLAGIEPERALMLVAGLPTAALRPGGNTGSCGVQRDYEGSGGCDRGGGDRMTRPAYAR